MPRQLHEPLSALVSPVGGEVLLSWPDELNDFSIVDDARQQQVVYFDIDTP